MAEPQYHRKIELQSPSDLQYLLTNIRRAADAEIERALPSLANLNPSHDSGPNLRDGKGDDMRVVVERLVGEYIEEVVRSTTRNITVNGMEVGEGEVRRAMAAGGGETLVEFERFDEKMDQKTRELMAVEEGLIEEVARLRREVPGRVVGRERETWGRVGGEDEGILRGVEEEGERGRDGDVLVLEGSNEGVNQGWGRGVKGLERMVGGEATGVGARKERAERAEGYVRGGK